MSVLPLFLIIIACSLGDVIIKNAFAKGGVCSDGDNHVFNAIACIIGAPMALLIYGLSPLSAFSLALGLGCGLCMGFVAIYGVLSYKTGSMSLTSMFGCFSMVIPILAGFLFWQEPITGMKMLGIALMFVSIYLIISPGSDGAVTKIWVRNVLIFALSTGLMTTLQQITAKTNPAESSSFLFVTYISATLFICLNLPYLQKRPELKITKKFFCMENLNGLLVGILGAVNTVCTMKILGRMDSTVFYPVKVGTCLILNALLAHLLFHEKHSKKQIAGFLLGTAAILILTIFD